MASGNFYVEFNRPRNRRTSHRSQAGDSDTACLQCYSIVLGATAYIALSLGSSRSQASTRHYLMVQPSTATYARATVCVGIRRHSHPSFLGPGTRTSDQTRRLRAMSGVRGPGLMTPLAGRRGVPPHIYATPEPSTIEEPVEEPDDASL
ncbi:hypothetical protein FKP32DRAFT_570100 [Trametes sanguinea]|nr:hypothetical protein FKP32DRAFT_570100 [Trametes sanguinea]